LKTKQIGSKGEVIALQYLELKGYELVLKNYRFKRAEIDLIVQKENLIVFVEVKYRKNADFGFPEEFVRKSQRRRIQTAAENYLSEMQWNQNIRFDIISIMPNADGNDYDIMHLEDAIY
jgi:putative endonuclease